MSTTLTILGCGSSAGVPRIGGDWGACDPGNPKNRRMRCSVLLQRESDVGATRVLIDTSPDMREQMLNAAVLALDSVWYTHEHADHTHGIDELRAFYLLQKKRIPVYADAATAAMLELRFAYCFSSPAGSDYPPIAALHEIHLGREIVAAGAGGEIIATPFSVQHGNIEALGYRVGNVAYTPDVNDISKTSLEYLTGLDVWIVDALRRRPHPSHFSLPETLAWIERLHPRKAILTNLHNDLDYMTLRSELPAHVVPAFDGMKISINQTLADNTRNNIP